MRCAIRKLRSFIIILLVLTLLFPRHVFAARDIPCAIRVGSSGVEVFKHRIEYYAAGDTKEYSPELSHMLAALSYAAYKQTNIRKSYYSLGFVNFKTYNYYQNYRDENYDEDSCAYAIGKKVLDDGSALVLVTIRGTYGSSESGDIPDEERENEYSNSLGQDWISNMNTGWVADASGFHSGFNTAAEEVLSSLKDFLGSLPKSGIKYVLTGHSRGGAIANLLSYELMNEGLSSELVYNYNFACPNNVYSGNEESPIAVSGYDNIFNVTSCRDIIAHLPGLFVDVLSNYNLDQLAFKITGGLAEFGKGWDKFGRTLYFCNDWDDKKELGLDFSFGAHLPSKYLEYLRKEEAVSSFRTWEEINEDVISNTSLTGLFKLISTYMKS